MLTATHSTHDRCQTLHTFCSVWSQLLTDEQRAEWIPDITGPGPITKAQEHEIGLRILDWYLRVHVPAWLDLCEATKEHARQLRVHAPLTDENAREFAPINRAAMDAANAAAKDAARAATWTAAGDAVWDAVWAAAWAAAWDAAWDAAWNAANAAAWAAARAAVAAPGEKLQPTTETLQRSVSQLVHDLAEQYRWWVDPGAECDRQLAAATCDEERDRAVGRYESEAA